MSSYFLQPSIDTWRNKLTPFIASFLAYDNDGRRISNKQLYIVYDITYDNSVPDLENHGTVLYSNKDGIIELHFEEKCRVSIDLYTVETFDETLDMDDEPDPDQYICYHVCSNFFIPFKPYITSFKAKYISDRKLAVNDNIPRKYIQVTVSKSDDSTTMFTIENPVYDDYKINPGIINHTGENTVTVSYYDFILDKLWEYDIIVLGKEQELSIEGIYNATLIDTDDDGTPDKEFIKHLHDIVKKEEILAYIIVYDGYDTYKRLMDADEWEFTSFPQITNTNLGFFQIKHNDLISDPIRVPFIWEPSMGRLDVWYEGVPVRVGDSLTPDNFRIWLYRKNGLRELLSLSQCTIEPRSFAITNEGINWYTISYKIDTEIIKDKAAVIGYIEPKYQKYNFQLLYYDPNLHCTVDVTEDFDEACKVFERRYFGWGKILDRIIALVKYGKYKLYAPVRTGLSVKCDTEWFIYCKNRKAIKAQLYKMHDELKKEE